jgi:hypothetical protein
VSGVPRCLAPSAAKKGSGAKEQWSSPIAAHRQSNRQHVSPQTAGGWPLCHPLHRPHARKAVAHRTHVFAGVACGIGKAMSRPLVQCVRLHRAAAEVVPLLFGAPIPATGRRRDEQKKGSAWAEKAPSQVQWPRNARLASEGARGRVHERPTSPRRPPAAMQRSLFEPLLCFTGERAGSFQKRDAPCRRSMPRASATKEAGIDAEASHYTTKH